MIVSAGYSMNYHLHGMFWSLGFLCFLDSSYEMRLGHNLTQKETIEKNKIDVHLTENLVYF